MALTTEQQATVNAAAATIEVLRASQQQAINECESCCADCLTQMENHRRDRDTNVNLLENQIKEQQEIIASFVSYL